MQDFIAININMVIQWANTLLLFLLLKHFLFQPVKAIIDKRQQEIKDAFDEADAAKVTAMAMEKEYVQKLESAKTEAAEIVREASKKAESRSEEIIVEAKQEAGRMMEKAHVEIEREKQKAMNDIKNDITDIATMIASKVIQKDVNSKDHEEMIHHFIDNVGDTSWQN